MNQAAPSYAEVVVNLPLQSGAFDYHIPETFSSTIKPGCLVEVPFGTQLVQGIVLQLVEVAQVPETKPIQSLVDPLPVLTGMQISLARQMAEETLSPLAMILELMIPPGLGKHGDIQYSISDGEGLASQSLTPLQTKVVALLHRRGSLRGRQINAAFPHIDWRKSIQPLIRSGWIFTQPVLPSPTVGPKTARTARLACPPGDVEKLGAESSRSEAVRQRRTAVLQFLSQERLPVQVTWILAATGAKPADLAWLAEKGWIQWGETEIWRDPLEEVEPAILPAPTLTPEQVFAVDGIARGLKQLAAGGNTPLFLLEGVTGSGKTEIYLQAAAKALELGRQVIILVPEISLTPQTVRRFLSRFPGRVGLIHSRLSDGERYDTWRRARSGHLDIIIGPRSALFAPLPHPGLIIIDECHDASYHQSEDPPFFDAVRSAELYAKISGSLLLLGSATPEITQRYRAERESWQVFCLPQRILAHSRAPSEPQNLPQFLPLPPVEIVDMRAELKEGNRSIFSRSLQDALNAVQKNGEQAILFLNRRGAATYVFCRTCGAILRCPRCDLPLTVHVDPDGLSCHSCGYNRKMPGKCPACGSNQIRQYGTGTQKVEQELNHLVPGLRTLRLDADTVQQKGSHEIILSHFVHHRADVLIGTQMLAKGLDLPLVTLVGVVLGDVGLTFPDYHTAERTFQVLTQVMGRAGRSVRGGRAILQTYQPEHHAIQFAARHDLEGFYRQELQFRRETHFPPFSRLVRLEYRHSRLQNAEQEAQKMAVRLRYWMEAGGFSSTDLIGPAPCFHGKRNGLYRWQIILRGPDPTALLRGKALEDWRVQVDPPDLL